MKPKKIKKWATISTLFFLGTCVSLFFFLRKTSQDKTEVVRHLTKESSFFIPLKITGFSSADIPYLNVNIENKTLTLKIDLGYEGDICLSSEIIKELNAKTFIASKPAYGLLGKTYKSDIYEIPRINIGDMDFFPVKAEEANLEFESDSNLGEKKGSTECDLGRIGWCLFHNFNLLVDCEHSILALCDSLETLKKRGYPVDSFTEDPLLLDRGFIEFEATTESGLLRCLLDTGSTWNMLNKDLENSSNDHIIFTPENVDQYSTLNPENKSLMNFDLKDVHKMSVFNIGEKKLTPKTFNRIKSPLAIDAILGMEFFDSTLIFIDFFNRKIYFYEYPSEEKTSLIPS